MHGDVKPMQGFDGKARRADQQENLDVGGRITLKCILQK
jgi:hypothetical protein